MKLRGPFFFSIIVIAFLIGAAYYPTPVNSDKEAIIMHTIIGSLNQLHYSPQAINDDFSKKVYDLYLDRMDGSRRWLTKTDVDQLKPYQLQLDDEANAGTFEFFDVSVDVLVKGVEKSQKIYREILSKPFDFGKIESIEMDGEKKPFAKNDEELYDYWRKSMKYETLIRLSNKLDEQKDIEDASKKKSFEVLEKESREAVLEVFDDWYNRMSKRRRSDYLSIYLNAMTNVFRSSFRLL